MRNALVLGIGLLSGVLFSVAGAFPVYADTLSSMTISSTHENNSGGSHVYTIRLGSGLTGLVSEISTMFAITNRASATAVGLQLQECTDNTYFSCTDPGGGTPQVTAVSGNIAVTQYFTSLNNAVNLNSAKYYQIVLSFSGGVTTDTFDVYGSATNTNQSSCLQSSGSWSSLSECFYILNGVNTDTDTSFTSGLSPVQASTTASTNVNFTFSYHAVASHNISEYAIFIRDDTTNSTIGPITGSASSGDHNVSRNITLTSLHRYTWQAYICNSSGTCYGGPAPFFYVVGNGGFLYTPTFTGTGTPPVINYDQYFDASQISESNSTSSLPTTIGSFFNIPAILASRVPFGWIYQLKESYDGAFASSTATSTASVVLDFDSIDIATGTRDILGHDLVLFSTSTVTQFFPPTVLVIFNALGSAALYLTLAGYVFRRVSFMFV